MICNRNLHQAVSWIKFTVVIFTIGLQGACAPSDPAASGENSNGEGTVVASTNSAPSNTSPGQQQSPQNGPPSSAADEPENRDLESEVDDPPTTQSKSDSADLAADDGNEGDGYSELDLHKNKTLLVLSFQPDIRADFLVQSVRAFIDDEQAKKAKRMAMTYNWRYEKLLKERAAILENATDQVDVKGPLRQIKIKTVELNSEIRKRISAEILTPEQRKQVAERYNRD